MTLWISAEHLCKNTHVLEKSNKADRAVRTQANEYAQEDFHIEVKERDMEQRSLR